MSETPPEIETAAPVTDAGQQAKPDENQLYFYRIRFRSVGQEYTISSRLPELVYGSLVFVKTDHGSEPAIIVGRAAGGMEKQGKRGVSYCVDRVGNREDEEKYARLPVLEQDGFDICSRQIKKLNLPMHLVRVERYFNGSKISFSLRYHVIINRHILGRN